MKVVEAHMIFCLSQPPTPEDRLTTLVIARPPRLPTAFPCPLHSFAETESRELMLTAFQGPSVFTLRRSGTMLWCVAVSFFSKHQYEFDKVNCCSSRKQLGVTK